MKLAVCALWPWLVAPAAAQVLHLPTSPRLARVEQEAPPNSGAFAPDGKRGLAGARDKGELARVFRQPSEDDKQFLGELYGLEGEVRTLIGLARAEWTLRKYFELIGGTSDNDALALLAEFRAAEKKSVEILKAKDARAVAYSHMYFDMRLRMRAQVLEGFEDEARELRSGLAVLRASTDGDVALESDEAHAIAVRVDLAASRLRAVRADLTALRTPDGELEPGAEIDRRAAVLMELTAAQNKDHDRAVELARWVEEIGARKAQMTQVLNSARLAPRLAPFIAWRESQRARAKQELESVVLHYPGTPESEKAPPDVKRLGKTQHMRFVRDHAARGLAYDPLDPELAWYFAKGIQFFDADIYSRPWFDRFLALRGIRASEWRTLEHRELDAREQEALNVVQRRDPPPTK